MSGHSVLLLLGWMVVARSCRYRTSSVAVCCRMTVRHHRIRIDYSCKWIRVDTGRIWIV